ncbi:YlxR family protein [Bacillota bacterium]
MKTRKIPMRRCVGCMESKPKKELVRIVCNPDGELSLDFIGKANGRGVYICPDADCIAKAKKKKAIARGLERDVDQEQLDKIFGELAEYERKDP